MQFRSRGDTKKFEQIAQSTAYGADFQSRRVFEELTDVDIRMAHPETLCDLGNTSAAFRMAQAIDDGPFEIADFGVLLFGDPMLHCAEEVFGLKEQKSELSSSKGLVRDSFGAGDEYCELGLRDHAVKFHGCSVGQEVGCAVNQVAGDQIRIAGILGCCSEFGWDQDEEATFQSGDKTALFSLVKKAAGEGHAQAGDLRRLGRCEHGLARVVEHHDEVGGAAPRSLEIMVCAQLLAHQANNYA